MTFEDKDGGVLFSVMLTARASKAVLSGTDRDFVRIKVCSPPIENKANIECIEVLSKVFSIAKSGIKIIKGHKNRRKEIYIDGIDAKRASQILNEHII